MCLFLLWWFTEEEENHVMEGKVDPKNDLTVVIDAYTGDKGSSPDSSTTKSESSFGW